MAIGLSDSGGPSISGRECRGQVGRAEYFGEGGSGTGRAGRDDLTRPMGCGREGRGEGCGLFYEELLGIGSVDGDDIDAAGQGSLNFVEICGKDSYLSFIPGDTYSTGLEF